MSSSSPVPWESFKELFSLDHGSIEQQVEDRPGQYKDLDPRALYTTLEDFFHIMKSPWTFGTWVDLGAGAGESVLMYASLFPERRSIGIECAGARVRAGEELRKRLGIGNAQLREADLLCCEIPDAQTFFLYFPTGHVLDRVLNELRAKGSFRYLIVVESHGDLLPRLNKEKWLKIVGRIPLSSPRHHPNAIVYERGADSNEVGPHQVSFHEKYLLFTDPRGEWIGDSFGLEWLKDEQYQLLRPPRTIEWGQLIKIMDQGELAPAVRLLVEVRKKGEVEITVKSTILQGHIRKILVRPCFEVEISTGEWVKWEDIKTIKADNHLCYESSLD